MWWVKLTLMFVAVHIIRDVVSWYQGFERCHHKGQGLQYPKTTKPIEVLLDSSVIPKLVEEGKAETIIDTLRSYNQLSCVDKEALVRRSSSVYLPIPNIFFLSSFIYPLILIAQLLTLSYFSL